MKENVNKASATQDVDGADELINSILMGYESQTQAWPDYVCPGGLCCTEDR
ncbi:hypothetical protein ACFX58_09220 [Sphingomonas sp. NCPPB 2930]